MKAEEGGWVDVQRLAPVLQGDVLPFQLLDLVPKGVASIVELHDVFLILIDLLLRQLGLALEFIGSFYQFSQLLGDGREIRVVGKVAAEVCHCEGIE